MNDQEESLLISTAYLPSVALLKRIKDSKEVLILAEENYQKQTFRNRTSILSSSGIMTLVIPVKHNNQKITEVEIDYSQGWLKNHIKAFISCYKHSPYFEYYFPYIEDIYNKRHIFLFDLNFKLLLFIKKALRLDFTLSLDYEFEHIYLKNYIDQQFRDKTQPAEPLLSIPYRQVFGSTFVPDLSVIDLILNMGPDSIDYL